MKRRDFLINNVVVSGGILGGASLIPELMADDSVLKAARSHSTAEKMIRVGCPAHNCGGRCLLKVFVREGVIVKIETDDRPTDGIEDPQLRACLRGRAYRHRQYHADRLRYPMKRTGKRGEGKFERISWNEATDLMAERLTATIEKYGNESFYIPWEEAGKYPLQVIGPHYMPRVHSTLANVDWLSEAFSQRIFINPIDAGQRGLRNGQKVKIYNDRGTVILPCRITSRILPGVVAIPQGAWWKPNDKGYDEGGCVNTLTSERWTPLAFGNAQHTIMAEVEPYNE